MESFAGCYPAQVAQGVVGGGGSSTPSRADTERRRWKEEFRDPAHRWDNRKSKTNPRAPDFDHEPSKELLWMDSSNNPSRVQDMLRRSRRTEESHAMEGMHKAQEEVKNSNKRSSAGGWEMLSLEEALASLEEGLSPRPSVENIAWVLHKCTKERNHACVPRLHAFMHKSGLEVHPLLGNHLASMLVEVGSMSDAQQLFDRLVSRKECSWNSLLTNYIRCGESHSALTLYQRMREEECAHPSPSTFVALLKACAELKDLERGCEIHADIARQGLLERDEVVGNTLVSMYAKCGLLAKAREVFDKLPVQNVVSWNTLIAGYAKHSQGDEALKCFEQMQHDGISPNAVTFICSLKACGSIGAIDKSQEIHAEIVRKGFLETDLRVGNALVDMYAKCGFLAKAHEAFDQLPVRNVVSWTALITGYIEHGRGEEALECFERMQQEGVAPNAVTFVCSLKACGSIGATSKGQEIHSEIARKGLLETDLRVGSSLVDMYVKCGSLEKAQEVLDMLPIRNVVSWTALIAGYAEHGHGEEALKSFEQMQQEGVSPNAVTFVCSLKACGSLGATNKGREIHIEIARKGLLERDMVVGNALIDMYAKCGSLEEAQEVFDRLPFRDIVSWNALIAGYAQHGRAKEALIGYEHMKSDGFSPDAVTFVCTLKACGSIGATDKGEEIHAEIVKKELLEIDFIVGNALVDMYAKCGSLAKAQEVLDRLPVRDVGSWNALMAGYIDHGRGEEALKCFEQMQLEGVTLDAATYVCSLKACSSIGATDKGGEIHAEIARKGLLDSDVGNALVDMYAKCGLLSKAQEVFDKLPVQDVVSWTALIAGHVQHRHGEEALNCFEQMQLQGISPDAATLVCSLKACASIRAIDKGREIHDEIARKGLLETDNIVGSTLVDMYAKCGFLEKAQQVFDMLPVRNVVSWTALIAGYAEHGWGEEALDCFELMQLEGVTPDAVTLLCSLKACGSIGAKDKGQEMHAEISRNGLLERDLVVGNALVDMYAKCGFLAKAQKVFNKLLVRDEVTWTALIAGYAQFGQIENAFLIFNKMIRESIKPSVATFIILLNACSHAGLVDKGQTYFEAMSKDYGIIPTVEHHTCIIDLLGRAGQLDKAIAMIKRMPFYPDLVVWHIVLGACQKWGNVELGREAFERAVQLEEKDPAAYVYMSNIYIDADMKADAKKVEVEK